MLLAFTLKALFALRGTISSVAAGPDAAERWAEHFSEAAVRDRL